MFNIFAKDFREVFHQNFDEYHCQSQKKFSVLESRAANKVNILLNHIVVW